MRGKALFESNSVSGSGGAFYGGSCDKVELDQAEFRSNHATWGGEHYVGACRLPHVEPPLFGFETLLSARHVLW